MEECLLLNLTNALTNEDCANRLSRVRFISKAPKNNAYLSMMALNVYVDKVFASFFTFDTQKQKIAHQLTCTI